MEIQLGRRSNDFGYIRECSLELLRSTEGRKPVFALYIDCLGRCGAYSETDQEYASVIQESIGSSMPLFGIYSGVEITPIREEQDSFLPLGRSFCKGSQKPLISMP